MKSKQVNFYLTPEDQGRLMSKIQDVVSYVVISGTSSQDHPVLLEDAIIKDMGKEDIQVYLACPVDIEDIIMSKSGRGSLRVVDDMRSPVIQFSRCYLGDGVLRRGRFYFVSAYYKSDKLHEKSARFVGWANSVLSVARRFLIKDTMHPEYYGQQALDLHQKGVVSFTSL